MAKLPKHERPLGKNGAHGNNPNGITVNQHVIPCKHILEWAQDGKMVRVYDIKSDTNKELPAKCAYFCVMRLWDHWTESEMLKTKEDNYQSQIDLLRKGIPLTNPEYITEYFILLCVRIWIANKERPHYPSLFLNLSHEHEKAELENNELEMEGSVHIIKGTLDSDSQHMARQLVKIAISQTYTNLRNRIQNHNWKVFNSEDFNFVLSDALYNNFLEDFYVLPINPKQVLIAESTYNFLNKIGYLRVDHINEKMIKNSVSYYIK